MRFLGFQFHLLRVHLLASTYLLARRSFDACHSCTERLSSLGFLLPGLSLLGFVVTGGLRFALSYAFADDLWRLVHLLLCVGNARETAWTSSCFENVPSIVKAPPCCVTESHMILLFPHARQDSAKQNLLACSDP